MKGPLDRTKVVVRNLPPAFTQAAFTEQIDGAFAGRYNWMSFRQGKTSQKHQSCARAYIDFKKPEDVLEFAEFFNGHVFVNEKGAQFKTIVEYAPSQRIPKQWSKNDGREGTILKDPEYLEFLEFIAKPVENLPSAEIQLERREAERAGVAKQSLIVTPLMDFVRQKRAAKAGPRRLLSNGKSRRASGSSSRSPASGTSKRGSEKKKYVLRDTAKNSSGNDKSTYILVPKRDDQGFDKPVGSSSATGSEVVEEESGVSANCDAGKKKVLLLKGKEREISQVASNVSQQQSASVKNILGSPAPKRNQRRESNGRIIKGILLNKEAHQSQAEQQVQNSDLEKDKRPPRLPHVQLVVKDTNGVPDGKHIVNDLHSKKQERRTRNKDRPDRGVWTLRRSDGSNASDESLSSSASQLALSAVDSSEGTLGDGKIDVSNVRSGEVKTVGCGHSSQSSLDNGSHRHIGRRGPIHSKVDSSSVISEGKPLKSGNASGYGSHEKQVWVQKSSPGS